MASTKVLSHAVAIIMVVAAVVVAAAAQQQQQLPSCEQKLIPCIDYLKYNGELAPCCAGLKDVVNNDVSCLCNLANQRLSNNVSKVDESRSPYDLPQQCGVPSYIQCPVNNGMGRIAGTTIPSLLLFGALVMML